MAVFSARVSFPAALSLNPQGVFIRPPCYRVGRYAHRQVVIAVLRDMPQTGALVVVVVVVVVWAHDRWS